MASGSAHLNANGKWGLDANGKWRIHNATPDCPDCCGPCWRQADLCAGEGEDPVYVPCADLVQGQVFRYLGGCYEGSANTFSTLPGTEATLDDEFDNCAECEDAATDPADCPSCESCPSTLTATFSSLVLNFLSINSGCNDPCKITFNGTVELTNTTGCTYLAGAFDCAELLAGSDTDDCADEGFTGFVRLERLSVLCSSGTWRISGSVCWEVASGTNRRSFNMRKTVYGWHVCVTDAGLWESDDGLAGDIGFCVESGSIALA